MQSRKRKREDCDAKTVDHKRIVERWVKDVLPTAIRIEMAPLAPDLGRLQPVTLTIPVHVTRLPLVPYDNTY